MSDPLRIIIFGAGVNSTAILALLKLGKLNYGEPEKDYKIVFADTGAENPETYCHIKQIEKEFSIHWVKRESPNLYDYCWQNQCVPARLLRWCTDKFKGRPIDAFKKTLNRECISVIGFDFQEKNRVQRFLSLDTKSEFPLYDLKLTRDQCKKIIRKVGWQIPPKSGCYFCPFHTVSEWKQLRGKYPDLFRRAEELERNAMIRYPKMFLHGEITLSKSLKTSQSQQLLYEFQGCLCRID